MNVTNVVWFRNDLRTIDNKALHEACKNPNSRVICLYIATPEQWKQHNISPRQATFIHQNLYYLAHNLTKKNIPLFYHQCTNFAAIAQWILLFCIKHKAINLFYNKQYALNERRRDDMVTQSLIGVCKVQSFDDALLLPPGSVLNNHGEMYKVFSLFRKVFLQTLNHTDTCSLPSPKKRNQISNVIRIQPFDYPRQQLDCKLFPAGESAALEKLHIFCCERVALYAKQRDIPSINGTSILSPYLTIGVLSPRQCLNELLNKYPKALNLNKDSGAFIWFNELIWREFYYHLLMAYPKICCNQSFIDWTDNICWHNQKEHLIAWQEGKTGYPIIDAAMRQLNYIGWMHNRLRMITASFLVKDLLINWRLGEHYFMSKLLDGDLAANNGGWQWAASSGTDAVPYFRIFNPITQGKRFDKNGTFIRRWLPELANVPDKNIHQPYQWAIKENTVLNYPYPIIDHTIARRQTIQVFKQAKINITFKK
ncbi:Deoxyribodipyrimidine photo-lyase [Candidatus Profftia lariciata]|uniref:deoxyribodipyrimidine photo-lyase n=1 Tax=Candidatus Profftia lariciata TaxID=1987921 RepID=UPI001D02790B|nr:deoxyribodipyrimidine photo-lyase [Candidatus Profftia lariciata]UDG81473.1 Deoxyribodipyrimidine photo-lyase [Candidatus Profftia lariciata]